MRARSEHMSQNRTVKDQHLPDVKRVRPKVWRQACDNDSPDLRNDSSNKNCHTLSDTHHTIHQRTAQLLECRRSSGRLYDLIHCRYAYRQGRSLLPDHLRYLCSFSHVHFSKLHTTKRLKDPLNCGSFLSTSAPKNRQRYRQNQGLKLKSLR